MSQSQKSTFGQFGQEIEQIESRRQAAKNKFLWLCIAALIVGTYNLRSYEQYGASISTYFLSVFGLGILTTAFYFFWKENKLNIVLDQKHLKRINTLFQK